MRNLRTYLIIISAIYFFTVVCVSSSIAGSIANWEKVVNGLQEEIFISFFEGYPVNRVYTKTLKPDESLVVDDFIEEPCVYYVISITRNVGKGTSETLWKAFSSQEYHSLSKMDNVDGFLIGEERLNDWERVAVD